MIGVAPGSAAGMGIASISGLRGSSPHRSYGRPPGAGNRGTLALGVRAPGGGVRLDEGRHDHDG